MGQLLDSGLWIVLARPRSPRKAKALVARHVDAAGACVAEPVVFEVLRGANDAESGLLSPYFETLPLLESPLGLWSDGVALGKACRAAGYCPGSIDLLIAAVAIDHDAELVTFDTDFEQIAEVSSLRVRVLAYPEAQGT